MLNHSRKLYLQSYLYITRRRTRIS